MATQGQPAKATDWLQRRPKIGDICVFTHGYGGLGDEFQHQLVPDWKRDALLFDRVYARCVDPKHPPDIPIELSFGIADCDREVIRSDVNSSQFFAQAFAGMTWEEIEKHSPGIGAAMTDFDGELSQKYSTLGVVGEWTYSNGHAYLKRFSEGQTLAYEGALNNVPLVTAESVSWDQILHFRADPEAKRKYRDLRVWLRSGIGAQSPAHATDIVGQKIEDYRWAIKRHGFETALGTLKEVFDWKTSGAALGAVTAGGAIGGPIWASLAGGLTIAAKITASICEKSLARQDVLRGPDRAVAILYEAQERFQER